jgi:hypothetical protein
MPRAHSALKRGVPRAWAQMRQINHRDRRIMHAQLVLSSIRPPTWPLLLRKLSNRTHLQHPRQRQQEEKTAGVIARMRKRARRKSVPQRSPLRHERRLRLQPLLQCHRICQHSLTCQSRSVSCPSTMLPLHTSPHISPFLSPPRVPMGARSPIALAVHILKIRAVQILLDLEDSHSTHRKKASNLQAGTTRWRALRVLRSHSSSFHQPHRLAARQARQRHVPCVTTAASCAALVQAEIRLPKSRLPNPQLAREAAKGRGKMRRQQPGRSKSKRRRRGHVSKVGVASISAPRSRVNCRQTSNGKNKKKSCVHVLKECA